MIGKDSTRPNRWRSAGTKPTPSGGVRAALHRDVAIVERDAAARRPAQAGDGLDKLVLAVAGDSGDAEDLACPHVEADVVDHFAAAVVPDDEIGHREGGGRPGG